MKNDDISVIPVLASPCKIKGHPFMENIQFVNDLNKPLSELSEAEQDMYLVELTELVAEEIER